jgi:hypothetical protein
MPALPPPALVWEAVREMLLPAMITSAVVLAVWLNVVGLRAASTGSALALVAGFAVTNAIRGALPFALDKTNGLHRVLWAAVPPLLLGQLAQAPRMPVWFGLVLRAGGAGLATWILAPPREIDSLPAAWLPWAFAGLVLASCLITEQSTYHSLGSDGVWCFVLTSFAAAVLLLHASFARGADAALMLGAALFGVVSVSSWLRADVRGAIPAAAVLVPGLLLVGKTDTFSEVPLISYVLVAMAPVVLLPTLAPFLRRFAGIWLLSLRMMLVLSLVVPAVVLAIRAVPDAFEGLP